MCAKNGTFWLGTAHSPKLKSVFLRPKDERVFSGSDGTKCIGHGITNVRKQLTSFVRLFKWGLVPNLHKLASKRYSWRA